MNLTNTIEFMKGKTCKALRYGRVCGFVGALMAFASCSDFLEENSQNLVYITKWQDLDELLVGGCYVPCNSNILCFL